MFSRINGVLDDTVAEGWHFRVPWFQYPIIYDIRAKAHRFTSPTGTKGELQYPFDMGTNSRSSFTGEVHSCRYPDPSGLLSRLANGEHQPACAGTAHA